MNELDKYFAKSKPWREEAGALREILLDCDVDEELKWGKPCYTHEGKNIAIIQQMNGFLALMFFKGALLTDPKDALEKPGKSSNAARRFEFTSLREVTRSKATIKRYVREAIKIEEAGMKVPKPKKKLALVEELKARLERDAKLKAAFEALTPGRQRAYNLYFSAAKKPETRERRIDKYVKKILAGKGMRD